MEPFRFSPRPATRLATFDSSCRDRSSSTAVRRGGMYGGALFVLMLFLALDTVLEVGPLAVRPSDSRVRKLHSLRARTQRSQGSPPRHRNLCRLHLTHARLARCIDFSFGLEVRCGPEEGCGQAMLHLLLAARWRVSSLDLPMSRWYWAWSPEMESVSAPMQRPVLARPSLAATNFTQRHVGFAMGCKTDSVQCAEACDSVVCVVKLFGK